MSHAEFLANPYIARIAKYPCWTISDARKIPIDIVQCIQNIDPANPNRIKLDRLPFAKYADTRCLVKLDTILEVFPGATNFAYYVQDASVDGYIILDVEPTCPDELRNWFLQTNYIYGEYSRSGKGLHLVYVTPKCLDNYPAALKKPKLQTKDKTYEFMIGGHYLTFTGRMLPPATGTNTIDRVLEELCKEQTHVESREIDIESEKPEIPNEETFLRLLRYVDIQPSINRTPDISKQEFGAAARFYYQLKKIIKSSAYNPKDIDYTDAQKAWLVYESLERALKHRAKHDTFRNELPWLLYIAYAVIAKDHSEDEEVEASDT